MSTVQDSGSVPPVAQILRWMEQSSKPPQFWTVPAKATESKATWVTPGVFPEPFAQDTSGGATATKPGTTTVSKSP